jgi:hypothetical protein
MQPRIPDSMGDPLRAGLPEVPTGQKAGLGGSKLA